MSTPKAKQTAKNTIESGAEMIDSADPSQVDSSQADTGNVRQIAPPTMESIFGSISWLMLHSPAHRHFFIADYEWLVLPALMSKQFRIIRQDNKPVAYVSWAFLDEGAEERISTGNKMPKLAPHEWQSGDRPWVIDIIAPFGGAKEILQKLNETEFKDKDVKILRLRKDGKGLEPVLLNKAIEEDVTTPAQGGVNAQDNK